MKFIFGIQSSDGYPSWKIRIQTVEIAGVTNADLAEMMVGRSVSLQTGTTTKVVLSIKDLVINVEIVPTVEKNLSLDVRAE